MTRIAIAGYGNIGKHAAQAVAAAPDMELAGIITRSGTPDAALNAKFINENTALQTLGKLDAVLLCKPTRQIEEQAVKYLRQGICTVDSFDIHSQIVDLRTTLDKTAKENNTAAVIAAGWDPGSDSVIRALLEAAAPVGITYTNFGPGMSMGHTVAVKSKPGIRDALSVTIPLGTGVHRRMVYVELEENTASGEGTASGKSTALEEVAAAIKADPYFSADETYVIAVESVAAITDKGHGVNMVRKAKSAASDNQLFTFDMRINNPALTAQIMSACARAAIRQAPGAYTILELPLIDMLPGSREGHIARLV